MPFPVSKQTIPNGYELEICLRRRQLRRKQARDQKLKRLMDSMPALCPRCHSVLRSDVVKTAIWQGDHLFVIEDIQAQVCDNCFEQFYDEDVTDALRRLAEGQFLTTTMKREILVPVFSLEGIGAPAAEPEPA